MGWAATPLPVWAGGGVAARLGAFVGVFLVEKFAGFVHSVTGLPSFVVTVPGVLWADDDVACEVARGVESVGFWEFSHVLAPVGQKVSYLYEGEDGELYGPVELTRVVPDCPDGGAVVATQNGRGVVVDLYEDTGDPLEFENRVSEFENGVVRFKRGKLSGSSRFVVDTPQRARQVRAVLEAPGLTLISPGQVAAGVDGVRCVLVKRAHYSRLSTEGDRQIDVEWTMKPFPGMQGRGGLKGPVVPAVTWGDAIRAGKSWGDWTVLELLRTVGYQG